MYLILSVCTCRCDGLLFSLTNKPVYLGSIPSAHSEWIRACAYNTKVCLLFYIITFYAGFITSQLMNKLLLFVVLFRLQSHSLYTVAEDALLCCWKPSHLVPSTSPKQKSAKISHKTKSASDRKPYKRR